MADLREVKRKASYCGWFGLVWRFWWSWVTLGELAPGSKNVSSQIQRSLPASPKWWCLTAMWWQGLGGTLHFRWGWCWWLAWLRRKGWQGQWRLQRFCGWKMTNKLPTSGKKQSFLLKISCMEEAGPVCENNAGGSLYIGNEEVQGALGGKQELHLL